MATALALLRRDTQLRDQAATWLTRWQDIADFCAPDRARILTMPGVSGPPESDTLYDSTAIHASDMLASNIHGTMTPATQPWISFIMRDEEQNAQQDVREWLEDVAKRIHKALRQSNFTTAAHEFYRDLVKFGTAGLFVEEKEAPANGTFGGFRFTALPIGTYRVAEDKDGYVDTVFRDLKLSRRQCLNLWGDKGVGPEFAAKAAQRPDEIVEVLHAVYPRTDRKYGSDGEVRRDSKNFPWASCYVIKEAKKVADEGGYEESPYVVARWSKIAGEVYGTGPSHTAIYDVKTLNAFVMYMLQAIPLAMQPPSVERDDSVQGDIDRAPAGRIVVSGPGPLGDNFMFLDTRYNPQIAEQFRVSMKLEIERQYHTDQLQLREAPQMTATEVQVRYEMMQRLLGPTTGRLEAEYLNPLTWRAFLLMARRQAFKDLPSTLQQAVGEGSSAADLDVQYEGPLARAQRTIELTAQDRTVAFVVGYASQVAAFSPAAAQEALDVLKMDKMTRDRAEITGLPSDSLSSAEDVDKVRAERKEAAAKQQQLAKAQTVSEIGKNLTPVLQATQQAKQGQPGKAA